MNNLAFDFINGKVPDTIIFVVLAIGLLVGVIWIIYKCIASVITLNCFKGKSQEDIEVFEEPPLTEIAVTLVSKECLVKTYGYKMPQTKQEYYFVFETEDKKLLRYMVNEGEYHLYDEKQKGTIAIVNDNYFGFCVNEDE